MTQEQQKAIKAMIDVLEYEEIEYPRSLHAPHTTDPNELDDDERLDLDVSVGWVRECRDARRAGIKSHLRELAFGGEVSRISDALRTLHDFLRDDHDARYLLEVLDTEIADYVREVLEPEEESSET